jgi:hypothetical protein
MRALRRLEIDGKRLKPIRNYPIEEEGDPEYDSTDLMEKFDHDHYHMMLKDYLSAEPAVRYQMARNYFERSLFSAEVCSLPCPPSSPRFCREPKTLPSCSTRMPQAL